jgi:hypothetical protein
LRSHQTRSGGGHGEWHARTPRALQWPKCHQPAIHQLKERHPTIPQAPYMGQRLRPRCKGLKVEPEARRYPLADPLHCRCTLIPAPLPGRRHSELAGRHPPGLGGKGGSSGPRGPSALAGGPHRRRAHGAPTPTPGATTPPYRCSPKEGATRPPGCQQTCGAAVSGAPVLPHKCRVGPLAQAMHKL